MAQSRYYSATAQPTVLTAAITPTTTVITVQQTVGFPTSVPYILALDYNTSSEEIVLVTAQAGTSLTVTRAYDSTSATSHNAGAAVRHTWTAMDGNDSRAHEAATANVHGVTGNLVGETQTQTLTNKTLSSPAITGTVTGSASYTTPTITNPTVTTGTFTTPTVKDETVTNTVTGNIPELVNAIAGTTADLFKVQLNASDKFRILPNGDVNVTPTSSATNGLLVNAATGFAGSLEKLQVNSVNKWVVDQNGNLTTANNATLSGTLTVGSSGQFTVNTSGDIATTGIGAFITKIKASDTSRASTTTMTADPDLASMPVVSNGVYIVEGMVFYSAIDTADLKIQFTATATSSMTWHGGTQATGTSGTTGVYIYDSQVLSTQYQPGGGDAAGNATIMTLDIKGVLRVGATSGNFGVQWAQNASNATATILRTNSYLTLTRIA